jgi:quercetin dioxygenase-like cupin family protein
MTLNDVARETDVSASFLSLVENGKSDIAIGRLVRLLAFYAIPVSDVLNDPPPADTHIVRHDEDRLLPSTQEGIEWFLLTSDTRHQMMPMLIVFEPGAHLAEPGFHKGEEFVHVLEGELSLELADSGMHLLSSGDSAYYSAEQIHLFRNASDKDPLRILCVNTPPTF